ncbi:MAG: FlgD immunoglobulin-like domain containing protein, partial [Candidatus Eisenbacteria bacterium]
PGQPSALNWGTGRNWVSAFAVGPDGAMYYAQNWTVYPQPDGQVRRIRRAFVTDVDPVATRRAALRVTRVAPNPAVGAVRLAFELGRSTTLTASIHDARGRSVRTLHRGGAIEAGPHALEWDGRDETGRRVPAGVYLARFAIPGTVRLVRVVRLAAGSPPGRAALDAD